MAPLVQNFGGEKKFIAHDVRMESHEILEENQQNLAQITQKVKRVDLTWKTF